MTGATQAVNDDLALQAILGLLADGEFHSGQELGEVLGVSRAAVWKHLQKLELLGLSLHSIKGKGYCLAGGLDLLSQTKILALLTATTKKLLKQLAVYSVLDSTNAQASRVSQEQGSGYVCLAELQTAGRGRRGRTWVSPFGKNIYLSIVWDFEGGATELEGLSLAVGVVLVEVLQSLGVAELTLKWPNDILWRGRKLAGILLEMTGDPAGSCQVIVGVGVNVTMPSSAAGEIDQPWVDLSSIMKFMHAVDGNNANILGRNELVAAFLAGLLPLLANYKRDRFAHYRATWESFNAYAEQRVELRMANTVVAGIMLGVTESGALRLATESGEQLFFGGEVSLRIGS